MSTKKPVTTSVSDCSVAKSIQGPPVKVDPSLQVGARQEHGGSVLIVDPQGEAREVLRTALERRGMTIIEARGGKQGLELAEQHDPDLVVVDLESEGAPGGMSLGFEQQSESRNRPLIILGEIQRRDAPRGNAQVVTKPYHYGPLIRKIEELVAKRHRHVSKAA